MRQNYHVYFGDVLSSEATEFRENEKYRESLHLVQDITPEEGKFLRRIIRNIVETTPNDFVTVGFFVTDAYHGEVKGFRYLLLKT